MLFTRCPDCQTNFRITAAALRKADGQVRCGHCSAVFNAYEELRDGGNSTGEPAATAPPPDVEFDSLSETDEYFALDEEPTPTAPDSGTANAPAPESGLDEPPSAEVATDDEPEPLPAQVATDDEPEPLPARVATDDEPEPLPAQVATDDEQQSLRTPAPTGDDEHESRVEAAMDVGDEIVEEDHPPDASEPSLEFNLPPDEWTTFFQHAVEQPLAENLPQGGGLTDPEREDSTEFRQREEDIIVGEVDVDFNVEDAEEDAGVLIGDDTEDGVSRVIQIPESDADAARLAAAIAPAADHGSATSVVIEEVESLEEEEASWSEADASTDAVAITRAGERFQFWNLLQTHRWRVGSTLFSALLLSQVLHHFRAPIAAQPLVGPLLQAAYSTAGVEIVPDWDITQYEIMDWVATADTGTGGPGSLRISARIHNSGPRAQPYPSVRLELKDRWEATVGSRVFTAAEYLPKDVAPDRVMDAGTTVPANLQVVDPGQDAYGFELDICAEIADGRITCASDTVFQ